MTLQPLLLLLYSFALVALGVAVGRRVQSAGAFFVAGRSLGPGLLFATLLAANIGAGSTVGAASLGYADGLSAWWWVGSSALGTLVLAVSVGPRIWRLAKEHELLTTGDFLEWRYGRSVRFVVTLLLWVSTPFILAGQLLGVGTVVEAVAGIDPWLGILIGGVVMTAYFSAGGLVTSAWVNLVQLVVLVLGFAVALPVALAAVGGWSTVAAAAPRPDWLDPMRGGASGWHYVTLLVPAFIVSPGIIQKVYGARDERAVRIGVGAVGVALLTFAFVPPLLGMIARTAAPELAAPDLALATLLAGALPLLLGTMALAAVVSAEVSSADAILFMLSTSLSEDLYRRFVDPEAGERRVLLVARIGAVGGGALGIGLALLLGSVVNALTFFYALMSMSLFVPVVAGIYARRAGTREALLAIAGGVGGYLVARYGLALPGTGLWNPQAIGLLVSGLACGAGMLLPATGTDDSSRREPRP